MKIAKIQFAPWDKIYDFSLNLPDIKTGDYVIVETELGLELGKVTSLTEKSKTELKLKPVLRLANYDDVVEVLDEKRKAETMDFCREMILKHDLKMKLVDVHFSFSGNRLNFAFIADGRIDFRLLVKDLAARFNANIRLTQIGTRDEARLSGDCGPCGRGLCCREFLDDFSSITSEMAEVQQVVHRGSERISGMCGRLMCCLAYEYEGYKDLVGKLPPVGTRVNLENAKGTVISHNILKQTIKVKLDPTRDDERPVIIEIDVNRKEHKKEDKNNNNKDNNNKKKKRRR